MGNGHLDDMGAISVLGTRRLIIPTVAALIVAGPVLYLQFVGRLGSMASETGWSFSERLYGWPLTYGTRMVEEPWYPDYGVSRVGPLDRFSGESLLFDSVVCTVMIAGAFYVTRGSVSALQTRQFSLRSLLLLPVVTAGICSFIKYERSSDLVHFLVSFAPTESSGIPTWPVRFSQAITDSPPYMFVPILFGVAAGMYACLSTMAALIALLCRTACQGSGSCSARSTRHRALAILLLLGMIGGAAYLAGAARRAFTVARTAVFGRIATEWVTLYVMAHGGEWPRSWDTLRECGPPLSLREIDPAGMIETLKSVVEIDFQADPRVLATQTAGEFCAIRSLDGYGVDHHEYWGVPSLIETLQDVHGPAVKQSEPQSESSHSHGEYGIAQPVR